MISDRALARPIVPLLVPGMVLLPFALVFALASFLFPLSPWVLPACIIVFMLCLVLFTPYLLLVEGCFWWLSQIDPSKGFDPKELAVRITVCVIVGDLLFLAHLGALAQGIQNQRIKAWRKGRSLVGVCFGLAGCAGYSCRDGVFFLFSEVKRSFECGAGLTAGAGGRRIGP